MGRRCFTLLIGFLLLAFLAIGLPGCKEEKAAPQGETAEQQEAPTVEEEKTGEATTAPKDTLDFEEEEGVEQESPPQYDY
jgi:hypothetical protein